MKKVLIIMFVVMFSSLGFSQNTENVSYEKEGDLVSVTKYYEDGSIKEQGFYKDKKLHGEWTMYNREGVKVVRAHYHNGNKVGKWMFLANNTLTEVDYEDSRIASVHEWSGNVANN